MTPRSWADLFTRNGDGHAGPDPALVSRMLGPVVNAMTAPFTRLRALMDPRRDIESECGYPSLTEAVPVELYSQLYHRSAVAARVVEVYSEESWQVTPSVYEDENAEEATPFEAAWDGLGAGLYEDPECCYAEEEGSPVWEALKCADVLSGVGRYGVLVLGLDDGAELSAPAVPTPGRKLTFLTPLPEHLALITATDPRKSSRRYGLPTQYAVTLGDPAEQYGAALSAGPASSTSTVHWSRVVHVADVGHQAPTSRVYAVPRMRPVLNQLLGLHKLYACAPEMFWLAALPMLKFVTHAQLGGDVDVDLGELKDALEQARNSLQRMVLGRGGDWGTVGPAVSDPTSQIAVQLEAVCIKLGCPVRVFKGSERGELASSQDDQAWNDRLKARQSRYITPRIIVPFVQRLISLGVLPRPKRFKVWWPDLTSVSDGQRADVALKRVQALSAYVGGNVESVMGPLDFYTREMDYTEEEAAAILDNAGGALPSGDGADLGAEPYTQPDEARPAAGDYVPAPSANAWSEAARAAAIEARRAKMRQKEPAAPKQRGKSAAAKPASGKGKPADVKVKAAADKVAAINAKVTAAKAKLDKLKGDLKAAKADHAAIKTGVKGAVASGKPTKADVAAKEAAASLGQLRDAGMKDVMRDETKAVAISERVKKEALKEMGKTSPHKVARELGMKQKFKSVDAARQAVLDHLTGPIGAYARGGQ